MTDQHAAKVILWAAAVAIVWLIVPSDLTVHRVILVAAGLALSYVGVVAFVWLMELPRKRRRPGGR